MPEMDKNTPDYIAYVALGVLSFCFGSTFYFNALTLDWFTALGSGTGRIIVACAFLVPISFVSGHGFPNSFRQWVWVSALGILGMLLPFLMVVWGQRYVPSNVAAGFFSSIPLLMLMFSRVILKVPVTRRKWIGLLVGSIGLLTLSGPGTFSQIGSTGQYLPQLAILLACVLLAGAAIFVRLMPKAPPIQTTSGALFVASIVSLPIAVSEIPMTAPPMLPLVGLIGAGVISTGIGNLIRLFLIRRKGPVFITPNSYLVTVIAALLGMSFLGENLTPATLFAFAVIFAGLLIAHDGTGSMRRS